MPGHHHHRHGELGAHSPLAQQRHAIGIRHPDVKQNERGLVARTVAACFARVFGETHPVTLVLQDFGEQFADADLVVDDQNFLG